MVRKKQYDLKNKFYSFEEYLSMGNITITHSFIMILSSENRPGFVLADILVKAIKEDLHVGSIKEERVCVILTSSP